MKKFYLLLSLLAITFAACETDVEVTISTQTTSPISFCAEMTTRATDTAFEAGDKISVTAYATSETTISQSINYIYAQNVSYTYADAMFSSSTPITTLADDGELSFVAIYPYVAMSESKVVSFAVESDQSSGTNYTLSDLMVSEVEATTSDTPKLTFDHLLTKMVINVSSEDVDLTNITTQIHAVGDVEYDFTNGELSASTTTTAITMASNGEQSYKAIIVPSTIQSNSIFITITTADDTLYELYGITSVDLLSGKQYTINVALSAATTLYEISFGDISINDREDEDLDYDITDVQGTGTGTEADPYLISTAEQLRELSANVKAGISYEGEYFKMTKDIDLGGIDSDGNGIAANEFTAIGHYTSPSYYSYFKGTFDGDGHEVSGLYINQPEASYQGLFGCIKYATIKNLGVSGSVTGCWYTGGVVGYAFSSSTVSNCYNTGGVSGEDSCVGGVVGSSSSSSAASSTVNNCYNTGKVSGEGDRVGGVVGDADSSTVSDCYNTGEVSGSSRVGGVVGYADSSSTVSNCVYDSSVYTGSAIGLNQGTSTNVSGSATLTATMTSGNFAATLNGEQESAPWAEDYAVKINGGYPILSWQ